MLTSTDPRTGAATLTSLDATSAEQADAVVQAARGAFEASYSRDRIWRAGLLDAIADALDAQRMTGPFTLARAWSPTGLRA